MNLQRRGRHEDCALTVLNRLPLDPAPHRPQPGIGGETLLGEGINLRHGITEVRNPWYAGQTMQGEADEMGCGDGVSRPDHVGAQPMNEAKTLGKRSGKPGHPGIGQRHPADVAAAEAEMAQCIQGKGAVHRNVSGNLRELVVAHLPVGSGVRGEHGGRPAKSAQVTRKAQRPLEAAARATRRVVVCDEQDAPIPRRRLRSGVSCSARFHGSSRRR